jgi:hypothetical protein
MPFHVMASWANKGRAIALNWSEEDVQRRLVEPYEAGQPVVVQGQQFDPRHSRFEIIEAGEIGGEPTRQGWLELRKRGKDVTGNFLVRAPQEGTGEAGSADDEQSAVDPRTVMVIYGRDEVLTDALFQFFRALDLKPMEWGHLVSETGEGSPYIGEVLRRAFSIAQAAVVLLTPDDEARLAERLWRDDTPDDEKELRGQPRPKCFSRRACRSVGFQLAR